MQATIDISLYPLQDGYKQTILTFVKTLRKHADLCVETDGMSTQIIGEYDVLLSLLQREMKQVLFDNKAVFIIKLAKGERSFENLSEEFKAT